MTAKVVTNGMLSVFSRTGLPLQLLIDRGSQFTGRELCGLLGIERLLTTSYHPQTNGALERFHGTIEAVLTKVHSSGLDWAGLNSLCHEAGSK